MRVCVSCQFYCILLEINLDLCIFHHQIGPAALIQVDFFLYAV